MGWGWWLGGKGSGVQNEESSFTKQTLHSISVAVSLTPKRGRACCMTLKAKRERETVFVVYKVNTQLFHFPKAPFLPLFTAGGKISRKYNIFLDHRTRLIFLWGHWGSFSWLYKGLHMLVEPYYKRQDLRYLFCWKKGQCYKNGT